MSLIVMWRMAKNNLTGPRLRLAQEVLTKDQFHAYCEVVGVVFELSSVYTDFTIRWRPNMGHYRNFHIPKVGYKTKEESEIQSIWDQEFDPLFATVPAQIRLFIKSLATLRNKTYILVDLIDQLDVASKSKSNKLREDDFKIIDKSVGNGKDLLTFFNSNEAINFLKLRRNDSEHNIDNYFQKQMSSLLPQNYKVRDRLVMKYILPDYDRVIEAFEHLKANFMPVLDEYIK